MQYKKQRKTSWWIILLFIPLLFGCSPLAPQLWKVAISVGEVLIETVVGKTVEALVDKLMAYISPHVKPYPENPLKGRYTGDLTFYKETPNCKDVHIEKQPEMTRNSINDKWRSIPEIEERTDRFFQEKC
ncbi:MAG: hypothetical protein SGJ02_09125 [bacterium]|jgi:hypothetical protein|nr:hypothetical protein [bacterium]